MEIKVIKIISVTERKDYVLVEMSVMVGNKVREITDIFSYQGYEKLKETYSYIV